jgi:acyl dehydratase
MRTEQPSTVRAALRLVLDGMRYRGARPAGSPERRVVVEREAVRVDPARLRGFLEVARGDGIPGLAASDAPLPPTLPCLWETALALELLSVAGVGLPRGGLIHLESEVLPLRPMYSRESFRSRVELERVEAHARGQQLVLRSRCWNPAGQLCQESVVKLLARSAAPPPARPAAAARDRDEPERWRDLLEWPLPANLGRRYARVSGDYNPIHLWPWCARLIGYRRPLQHGFCIEAMVAHALIAEVLGGNPRALRRLQIYFRSPLYIPARVRLQVDDADGAGRRFRLVDAGAPTRRPYAEGRFTGAA